ncbi:MAG: hypothetical protein Q9209_002618 [Squamulea sp. 1 TL-2023]
MPSSFKQNGDFPPLRYRTPPPPVDAFEPHVPPSDLVYGLEAARQWHATNYSRNMLKQSLYSQDDRNAARRTQSRSSHDPMNAFACIALSTKERSPQPNRSNPPATAPKQRSRTIEQSDERPAKRARSEKLPSPAWVRAQADAASRPVTSYESVIDSRTMEAELLLNFSHSARFAIPSAAAQAHHGTSGGGRTELKFGRKQESLYTTQALNCLPHPLSNDSGHRSILENADVSRHIPGLNGEVQVRCSEPSVRHGRMPSSPEIPPLDFRHQLIEASNFGHGPSSLSDVQIARSTATLPQLQKGHGDPCCVKAHQGPHVPLAKQVKNSVQLGNSEYSEDGTVKYTLSTALEEHKKTDCTTGSHSTHAGWILANSYRPSMLATTIEQSICASKIRPYETIQPTESHTHPPTDGNGMQPSLQSENAKAACALEPATCAACNFTRNSTSAENDSESTSWISCDGCKCWFHFACAGFKTEREVRAVDKYRCRGCKRIHGPTTYVRKSARAHTAIDYAGLNQGVIKTSDERPEHHYIKPIRDGTINIQPESFARMRPDLITAEHFEKGNGMKEPIVIPAGFNPRPRPASASEKSVDVPVEDHRHATLLEDWLVRDPENRNVLDHGQDALDMVIPSGLTVRKVAELYGPEEKIEVIDVKSQNGEGKKWNMRRWADYYENTSKKVVRNVISLEVSQSTLGRLIRRPQIVRDLDLQDSVWPAELQAKGEYPHVQFYCLMSVADCFTDFHIDFGGSSVFYHILKGKKTFFFIPPKEKHLKKYEEWCMSPAQNWTFLGDQTKECYRVDLSEGDTMLIPAGWIHAVWTPEDSLVIGGNFLTRLNYSMQLRIAQVEKTTGVARKFRYPHFQKIQWYTAIQYLESDPLPKSVRSALKAGETFYRQYPAYHDFNAWGENSRSGREQYHARYYSQPELEGLPDLVRYLLRTALIDNGEITEGITVDARNAVKKSIPRGYGEPLDIVKDFAFWCAWKRGNEAIPHWAYTDAVPENGIPEPTTKISGAALKKLESEATVPAPRRQSARNQVQQSSLSAKVHDMALDMHSTNNVVQPEKPASSLLVDSKAVDGAPSTAYRRPSRDDESHGQSEIRTAGGKLRRKTAPVPSTGSQRKSACESCRRRRRACKHKTDPKPKTTSMPEVASIIGESQDQVVDSGTLTASEALENHTSQFVHYQTSANTIPDPNQINTPEINDMMSTISPQPAIRAYMEEGATDIVMSDTVGEVMNNINPQEVKYQQATPKARKPVDRNSLTTPQSQGRSKACNDCRKSKRRCLHDEHGQEDPLKVPDATQPRSAPASKHRKLARHGHKAPASNSSDKNVSLEHVFPLAYSVPSFTLHVPSEPQEDAAMVPISGPENTQAAIQHPSIATHELQSSCQLHSTINPVPDLPSTDAAQNRTEDLTPPSIQEQDVSGEPVDFERTVDIPGRSVIQLTSATPVNALKRELPVQPGNNGSFGHPTVSCLVSPPASPHEDSEQPDQAADTKFTNSRHSSRHSSRHMQTQRFTPESGPTRRDSSSSVAVDTSAAEERVSSTSSPVSSNQAPGSAQKQTKATLHSETAADEESLKLIRALQAQDYGLRRRRSRAA